MVDHPYEEVSKALQPAANWCEILMLHLNTKQCTVKVGAAARADGAAAGSAVLEVAVGGKHEEAPDQSQRIDFGYRVATASASLLDVRMRSDEGPMSTRDYRLWLQAGPVDGGRTFVHLHYSYGFGMAARIAMKAYLATVGRDKVGFSRSPDGGGEGDLVDGVRGVVERNAMRYYLAIDVYLDSLNESPARQREHRAAAWFDATERYPRQLHEIDRDEYLLMKRHEFARLPPR